MNTSSTPDQSLFRSAALKEKDENDDDEIFNFTAELNRETAFEKSFGCGNSFRINRKGGGGVFGTNAVVRNRRVADGNNNNNYRTKRFTGVTTKTKKQSNNSIVSESLDQESGVLADDSSPEFICRRSRFSPDDDEDLGDSMSRFSIPEDLQGGFRGPPIDNNLSSSSMLEPRSQIAIDRCYRSVSNNNIGEPPIPKRRIFQRSHSLSLVAATNKEPNWSTVRGDLFGENAHPNLYVQDLAAVDKPCEPSNRKRIRGRRHSMLGNLPSTSIGRTSSCSSSQTFSNLPEDLSWLENKSSCSSPSKHTTDVESHLQESVDELAAFSRASSPAARSTTSSRKRGVCCSPTSDQADTDEWQLLSSSSFSDSRRSRSRIFSPPQGEIMPMIPSLARTVPAVNEMSRRFDAMQVDDSSDDETNQASSPDTSFEVLENPSGKTDDIETEQIYSVDTAQVIETMTSFEDLKYLVGELRKHSRRHKPIFTAKDNWKIAPPAKDWTSQRRAAFTSWTKTILGFTVRSAGAGMTFIEISREKGTSVLQLLERTLDENKATHIDCEYKQPAIFTTTSSKAFSDASIQSVKEDANKTSISNTIEEFAADSNLVKTETDELVDKISSLNMNGNNRCSVNSSLVRAVTLPQDDNACQNFSLRLSIEGGSEGLQPRSSVDSQAQGTDFNVHLLGQSPRVNMGRPPKMSIGSVCSSNTVQAASDINATCQNNNFVMTPLINVDRGWGSRPVRGRDWGISESYDQLLIDTLSSEFEATHIAEEPRDSLGPLLPALPRSSSAMAFALETDASDDGDCNMDEFDQINIQRKEKKRRNDWSKRRRMSIFTTAAGCQTVLPRQRLTTSPGFAKILPAVETSAAGEVGKNESLISSIFSFLNESDLLTAGFSVCQKWSDWATDAHANLLLTCVEEFADNVADKENSKTEMIMEKSWKSLHGTFPWARFLAQGGAKKVFKVHNASVGQYEALSIMDTNEIEDLQIVASELAVTAMLSSLARRGICPNFIIMRGVFTCAHPPPTNFWGDEDTKCPKGKTFVKNKACRAPKTPKNGDPGRYQYIRMELVNEGDAEELIKRQEHEIFEFDVARAMLFQIAFAMHAAADKFSVKHYDLKLLNVFVQSLCDTGSNVVLRYGLGSHVFALRMPSHQAFVAKLADFGTANTDPSTNGQPVGIAHFTTLENTPPDFLILGNHAKQGHEHDSFGLGLCMLHLFTGHRPYEEIMDKVHCPTNLKKQLQEVWENDNNEDYSVIRSVIYDGVYTDDHGHIIEGDPDETFYDTFYRFLVLFGIPSVQFQQKSGAKVWNAINDCLQPQKDIRSRGGKTSRKKTLSDVTRYNRDCKKFSIRTGSNKYIARARRALVSIDGGLDLLLQLCSFDPSNRATAMDVLNSTFMEDLREDPRNSVTYDGERVFSYTSFSTNF